MAQPFIKAQTAKQKLQAQATTRITPFNNSKASLTAGLQLNDVADLEAWQASDLWKPYFDEFVQDWLQPHIDHCAANDIPVSKGPDFKQIQEHFTYEESIGKRQFTSGRVRKNGWAEIDHYTYLLHMTADENTIDVDGVLRGKKSTPDQRKWAMHQVMIYCKRPFSVSKVARKKKSEAKKAKQDEQTATSGAATPKAPLAITHSAKEPGKSDIREDTNSNYEYRVNENLHSD